MYGAFFSRHKQADKLKSREMKRQKLLNCGEDVDMDGCGDVDGTKTSGKA